MLPKPQTFVVDGIEFQVQFGAELQFVVAILSASQPKYSRLASVLTMAWKLVPVELLKSLRDGRYVGPGELFSITCNDPPIDLDEPIGIIVAVDEWEEVFPRQFFTSVVQNLASIHIQAIGIECVPWLERGDCRSRLSTA